jgi:hypothetical protein
MTPDLHKELISILTETLKYRNGLRIVRYSISDIQQVDLPEDLLLKLLYNLSNVRDFTESTILAVYLRLHPQSNQLVTYNPTVLAQEQTVRKRTPIESDTPPKPGRLRLDDLIREAEKVESDKDAQGE